MADVTERRSNILTCILAVAILGGGAFLAVHVDRPERVVMRASHVSRSPHWRTFAANVKEKHPACAACGGKVDLQVHHEVPFHTNPALELDERNVIVLCGPGGENDHLWIGHGGDYHSFNPNVRRDAERKLKMIEERLPNQPIPGPPR